MSDFLERHGTVLLLYSLLIFLIALTYRIGTHMGVDGKTLFAYFSGFGSGVFSTLALAMRVTNGPVSVPSQSTAPPPASVQPGNQAK